MAKKKQHEIMDFRESFSARKFDGLWDSETDFVKRGIMPLLVELGVEVFWRQNQGAARTKSGGFVRFTYGIEGISDVLGILPRPWWVRSGIVVAGTETETNWGGRFFAIEAKYGKNTATPEQLNFIDKVNRSGGLAFVAYDLETVRRALGRP